MLELAATYQTALIALAVWTLALIILGFGAGLYKNVINNRQSGQDIPADFSDPVFRTERAFMNSIENNTTFITAALLAMIAGASVTLVTWLVVLVVILRLVFAALYILRIHKDGGGIRTIVYVLSEALKFVLIIVAILALF